MTRPKAFMRLYWADLLADTLHLGRSEFGSYMLLIGAYWRQGGPLQDDDECLRNICRCDVSEWARCKGMLSNLFDINDGYWTHKRIDQELKRAWEDYQSAIDRTKQATAARQRDVARNDERDVSRDVERHVERNDQRDDGRNVTQSESESDIVHTHARAEDSHLPNLKDVLTVASMSAVTEVSAKAFFDYHQDNNLWLNRNGLLINWRSKLVSWAAKDRSQGHTATGKRQTIHELRAVIEAKREMADGIKHKHYNDVAGGGSWSNQTKRTEYVALKKEIKALTERLAHSA